MSECQRKQEIREALVAVLQDPTDVELGQRLVTAVAENVGITGTKLWWSEVRPVVAEAYQEAADAFWEEHS